MQDAKGQQAPMFTQFQSSLMFSNPAFAGMREGICVNGIYRQQWAGFKDGNGDVVSPQDFLLSLDSPLKVLHGGIGGSIMQDKAGQQSDIIVQLDYSFHLNLSFGDLGLGAGLIIDNRTLDGTKYDPAQPGDTKIPTSNESDMRLDAAVGLFLNMPDRYFFGFSVTNIMETGFPKFGPTGEGGEAITATDRTFYITGGYNFILPSNPLFELQPSIFILSDLVSTQYNITGTVTYNNKFWVGINYRFQESVDFIVGVQFKDIRIGYSYDWNTMQYGIPGSHEISLGYCFKIKGDRSKTTYKNTRYL